MSGDTLSDWIDRIGEKHGFTESTTSDEELPEGGPSLARNDLGSSTKAPVSFPGDDEEQRRIANARGPNQSRQGQPVSAPGDDSPEPEPVPEDATPQVLVDGVKFVAKKAVELGVGKLLGVPGIIIDLPFGLESDESPEQRAARQRGEEKDQKAFEDEQAKEQKEIQDANERGRAPVELNPIKVFDAPAERETSAANAFQSPAPSFSESAAGSSGGGGGGGDPQPERIQQEAGTTQSDDDD